MGKSDKSNACFAYFHFAIKQCLRKITNLDQLQHLRQQQHEILRQQNITEQATSRTTTVTTARVRFHTPPDQCSGFIQYDLQALESAKYIWSKVY